MLAGGSSADPVLENNDWETISEIAKAGKAAEYWKIGDTKTFAMGSGGYSNWTAQIVAFDYNDVADVSNYGRAKAGITFQFVEATENTYTFMKTNYNYWDSSYVRTNINYYYDSIEDELKAVIVPVNTKYLTKYNGTSFGTVVDKLYVASRTEMEGGVVGSSQVLEGTQFPYYANGNTRIKYRPGTTEKRAYWTRSPGINSMYRYYVNASSGSISSADGRNVSYAVAPCFCV